MILIVSRNESETKHAVSRSFGLKVSRRTGQALSALTAEFQEVDQRDLMMAQQLWSRHFGDLESHVMRRGKLVGYVRAVRLLL
jgi:hypothetical protein